MSKQPIAHVLKGDPSLMVQATQDVLENCVDTLWTRTKVDPVSELPIRLSNWALHGWKIFRSGKCQSRRRMLASWLATVLRVSIVLLPVLLLRSTHGFFAGLSCCDPNVPTPVCRARYARNELDRRSEEASAFGHSGDTVAGTTELFRATRLVLPRRLVMYADKNWILAKDPPPTTEYVFISWHWASFKYDRNKPRRDALALVKQMARHATLDAGLKAYWLDVQCVTDEGSGDTFSSDVYGMADIVRNAHHVAILLPSGHSFHKREWARRLWTLPEGLLARGKLRIWTVADTGFNRSDLDRVEMTCEFWRPFEDDERHYPTRILAEYHEGYIELSRFEMVITAIAALSRQDSSNFTPADTAYALMGLLRRRLLVNKNDTLFQAMTKLLSLTGENEYVIERMLSSYPPPAKDLKATLRYLMDQDQFCTHLWDVRPYCEVVGVDDISGVVFLNNCRTLPILHRSLPDQKEKLFRELRPFSKPVILLLCLVWLSLLRLCTKSLGVLGASCIFLLIAPALSNNDPAEAIRLEDDFILIEGTLPLSQLEALVFGGRSQRLSYATSSSPLNPREAKRDPSWVENQNCKRWTKELYTARVLGQEPDWIHAGKKAITPTSPASPISPLLRRTSNLLEPPQETYFPAIHPGHSLFTLLCMSTAEVFLVQAVRPPTTLMMTGMEGGMLRAVLCSSMYDDFGEEVLQKEAVLRLRPDFWGRGTLRSWLRVKMMQC